MAVGDEAVDRAADKLQETADRAAARGGVAAKAAQPLADDAAFLRKLKPSLIAARARGELPTGQPPVEGAPNAPAGAQRGPRRTGNGGPNPFVVVGAALALGVFLAKVLDWRSHAHPRG
ncbi:MAG TPA: hypothetical protein VK874_03170 [Gaiellaceae bacterium]|nr:hypothetical protein [Gaiellaceae bacterium]